MPALSGILQADPVSYTATLGSESVTITFDSAKMTGRWERDIRHAMDADDVDKVAERLFSVFIDWDVVDDQGNRVPISYEVLLDLPAKALISLFQGMQEAGTPSSEEGNASSNTLSTQTQSSMPTQGNPLNGQELSTSPQSSTSPSPT